jgi:hypothetical protein
MEQGEADRLEVHAENQGRLVDPDQASDGEAPRDLAMFYLAIDSKAMPGSTIARPLLLDPKSDSPTRHSVVDSAR